MFAITAITGRVGSALATSLLERGARVRAVVRSAEKGAPWRARGAEVALADADDAEALATAFTGVEGVFVLLPPNFAPSPGFPETTKQIAAFKAALLVAAPPKVVVLSTVGAQHATDIGILRALWLLEQELGSLPMPVTFLRAAWFMDNAEWDVAPARDSGSFGSFLQPVDRAIPMIAAADVGTTAADLLLETWTGTRVVELAGEAVSPADLAASLGRAVGRPVVAQTGPRATWTTLFQKQGTAWPEPRIAMLDGFNSGWIAFEGRERRHGATRLDEVMRALVGKR